MNSLSSEKIIEQILPTLQDLIFVLVFVGALLLGQSMMNIDGDLGRHLTIGEYILSNRTIPMQDVFSHTMTGEPLTPHEWLSQVFFALLYRSGGLNLVVWGCALILSISFALLFKLSWQLSKNALVSVGVVFLGVFASSLHWLTRPHLFTILFLILWLIILFQIRAGHHRRWIWLPVLMLFWVNLHGAFIAGLLSMIVFVLGMMWDRWILRNEAQIVLAPWLFGFLGSLLVITINPAGYRIVNTSIGYLQNRYLVGHTAEYLPPNFHDPSTWPFLLMILALCFLLGAQRSRVPGPMLFLTVAWSGMALYSTRNIPLFVIAASPTLALAGAVLFQEQVFQRIQEFESRIAEIQTRLRGWILPAFIVLATAILMIRTPNVFGNRNRFLEEIFPVDAADWLEENPQQGNMFNYFPWGGYLLYRGWPDLSVFIDGQTDFYGEALTRQYEKILTVQDDWEKLLLDYEVTWVIMPVESRLSYALETEENWISIYEDETAVIYRLRGSSSESFAVRRMMPSFTD